VTGSILVTYVPFLYPLPGAWNVWWLLLLPLCAALAIVYKSIKCRSMKQVPLEAAVILFWIIGGLVASAALLAAVVKAAGR
jgi:hypothetical protein